MTLYGEPDNSIPEQDLKIDVYRAGNSSIAFETGADPRPGIRITHIPTGLQVEGRTEIMGSMKVLKWNLLRDLNMEVNRHYAAQEQYT